MSSDAQRLVYHGAEEFGAAVSGLFQPVRFEAPAGRFRAAMEACHAGDVMLSVVATGPHEIYCPYGPGRAATAPVKVMVPVGGAAVLRQYNREITVEPGNLALLDTADQYWIEGGRGFEFLIMMLPREGFGLDNARLAEGMAVPLADGPLSSAAPYLTALAANLGVCAAPSGAGLARHTADLIATMTRARLGSPAAVPGERGAGLLGTVRAYIAAHLADLALNPAMIAEGTQITVPHLHALFRETGVGVADYVRAERLESARRDLLDPGSTGLGVTGIAVRWGFADGAHFARAFRAAYGTTPREYRKDRALQRA